MWYLMCVCVCVCVSVCLCGCARARSLSCVRLFVTPWTEACQAPLSMKFSSENTRMGCHFLLQEIFPTQGPHSRLLCLLHWKVDSLLPSHLGRPWYKGPWYKCALSSFLPWRTVTFVFLNQEVESSLLVAWETKCTTLYHLNVKRAQIVFCKKAYLAGAEFPRSHSFTG